MASRFFLARSRALTLNITRALNPFDTSSNARCLFVSQPLVFSPPSPTNRRPAGSTFSSPFDAIKGGARGVSRCFADVKAREGEEFYFSMAKICQNEGKLPRSYCKIKSPKPFPG